MAVVPHIAAAQNASDPLEWSESFVRAVGRDLETAFNDMKTSTYLGQNGGAATETQREFVRNHVRNHGAVLGHEVIAVQDMGSRLRRVVIALHHRKLPQIMQFYFYQQEPSKGWYLTAMRNASSALEMPWPALPGVTTP
ncbi:MAG: hypothetical protein VW600_17630 [Ferrovibrio sp.]